MVAPILSDDSRKLFQPVTLGSLKLSHAVVLAPMTRCRGLPSPTTPGTFIAGELMREYYEQRATSGGLMISEAIPVSLQAGTMDCVPGLFTEEQMESWKPVVDAVHALGGVFVAQLWHQGRTRYNPVEGHPIVSSSATRIERTITGGQGAVPVAMTLEDIERTKEDYVHAAKNAILAGFDGVEIHGANGYLPDQFLHSNINKRTDAYGGSIENRNRFVVELSTAVAEAIGADKFGLRLAPYGFFNETHGTERLAQWKLLCETIAPLGFAYVHFMEPRYDEVRSGDEKLKDMGMETPNGTEITLEPFRAALGGKGGVPVIVAGGYDGSNSHGVLEDGKAEAIAYGRYFTSNPDLVYRLQHDVPLVRYIRPRFYGPFEDQTIAYTDFPFCEALSNTAERKKMLEHSKTLGLQIAEPGWQLSRSGIQLGGLFGNKTE